MVQIVSPSLLAALSSDGKITLFAVIGAVLLVVAGILVWFFTYKRKHTSSEENKQSFLTVNQAEDAEKNNINNVVPEQFEKEISDFAKQDRDAEKAVEDKIVETKLSDSNAIMADIDTKVDTAESLSDTSEDYLNEGTDADEDFLDNTFNSVLVQLPQDIEETTESAPEPEKLIWKVEDVSSLYVAQDDAIILKRSMNNKLKFANDDIKDYYNKIKNELMSYKVVKSRMSNVSENFRKKRELLAKITLAGDNLKVFLALSVNDYPPNIYHQKDMSKMDLYIAVPFMVKVKTKLATRKACFLVSEVMRKFGLEKNPKFVEQDYRLELVPKPNEVLSKSRSVITMREGELENKIRKYKKQAGIKTDITADVIADVVAGVVPVATTVVPTDVD